MACALCLEVSIAVSQSSSLSSSPNLRQWISYKQHTAMAEPASLNGQRLARPSIHMPSDDIASATDKVPRTSRRRQVHRASSLTRPSKVEKTPSSRRPSRRNQDKPPSASSHNSRSNMEMPVTTPDSSRTTKTGRKSKAKKGLWVHRCTECGKVCFLLPTWPRTLCSPRKLPANL